MSSSLKIINNTQYTATYMEVDGHIIYEFKPGNEYYLRKKGFNLETDVEIIFNHDLLGERRTRFKIRTGLTNGEINIYYIMTEAKSIIIPMIISDSQRN